ncbi:hypothetical protein L6164_001817 [Bauhinia variegata]|uniref:Uncharacterized protein n=1 Tax=Bauhinia variegata TaxID=167791 RepID=A0ACB9QBA4_BAUVA|nr:hypothetical protein L6164_001817 [Bauhinia variegata]
MTILLSAILTWSSWLSGQLGLDQVGFFRLGRFWYLHLALPRPMPARSHPRTAPAAEPLAHPSLARTYRGREVKH